MTTKLVCKANNSDYLAIGYMFRIEEGFKNRFILDKADVVSVYEDEYVLELAMMGVTVIAEI